jgi:hypothetical protein
LGTHLPADVVLDELLESFGDLATFSRDPPVEFRGDVLRGIARPAFGWIENHDPQRLFVLAGEEVFDDRGDIGLALEPALKSSSTR